MKRFMLFSILILFSFSLVFAEEVLGGSVSVVGFSDGEEFVGDSFSDSSDVDVTPDNSGFFRNNLFLFSGIVLILLILIIYLYKRNKNKSKNLKKKI